MSSPKRVNQLVSTVDNVGMQVLQARNNDGCGGTYDCKLYAQVSGRIVSTATTYVRSTALLWLLTCCFALRVADLPPVAFTASLHYYLLCTYGNRRIFHQCGRLFFSATSFAVVDQFFSAKKKKWFFQTKFIRVGAGSGLVVDRVKLRSGVFFAEKDGRSH